MKTRMKVMSGDNVHWEDVTPKWKKRIKRWLWLTLVAAMYVATYCAGYYHCDRHVRYILKDSIIITP